MPRPLRISGFCKLQQNRILKNYDVINLVTGPEGSGKSGFADWCAHKVDPEFDYEKHTVFYDIDHFWKLWREDSPGQNIILDEAVAQLFNRKHGTSEAIQLVEEMITGRFRRKVLWLCIPRKEVIDPYIRKYRAKYWIWIPEKRGMVKIRQANWKEFENPKLKDGTFWEPILRSNYPPVPKAFEEMYTRLRYDAKKKYDVKRMTYGSAPIDCKRCDEKIYFKKHGRAWVPYNVSDNAEHIPTCGK